MIILLARFIEELTPCLLETYNIHPTEVGCMGDLFDAIPESFFLEVEGNIRLISTVPLEGVIRSVQLIIK